MNSGVVVEVHSTVFVCANGHEFTPLVQHDGLLSPPSNCPQPFTRSGIHGVCGAPIELKTK